jgi:hypothetical protein
MNLLPAGDDQRYRKMCTAEIDRACEMFLCLQGLVSVKTAEPKTSVFDCCELVRSIAVEHGLTDLLPPAALGASGAENGMVTGNLERARQAFASLMTILARVRGTGGAIEASCRHTDQLLVFSFTTGNGAGQRLSSANRLHLSLARANIVNQNGRFYSQADPLAIRVGLPLAQLS